VTGEQTSGRLTLFEAAVPPQGGPPPHIHHREDEFYYILEGTFEIFDGNQTFLVDAGSFVMIPQGTLHAYKNVGESVGKFLTFFTPAGFEQLFFEVGQPARPGEMSPPVQPEEVAKILHLAPQYHAEVPLPAEQ